MSKSRVRKKNGKKVKYTPPVQGISKTKMKKIQEYFALQKELQEAQKQQEDQLPSPPAEIVLEDQITEVQNSNEDQKGPVGS